MGRLIEKTKSVCPKCMKILDAEVIEENGAVYMKKGCLDHGFFKSILSKYAWYYEGLNNFYDMLSPRKDCFNKKAIKSFQFFPTLKCNLDCNICFTNSKYDDSAEKNIDGHLSLDEIKRMIRTIERPGKRIAILGGEPTLREDLPEVIKIISLAGHHPWLFTNGLKFSSVSYLEKLKKAGLKYVFIWIDTLKDKSIYKKLRGHDLLDEKKLALENLMAVNMPTGIVSVIVRGINEREIGSIIDFVKRNKYIHFLNFRGYSDLGKGRLLSFEEFTFDELVEILVRESNGCLTLKEFFYFQKIIYIIKTLFLHSPVCYMKQDIYIPRGNGKTMREIFNMKSLSEHIDVFEEIYKSSPLKARGYFLKYIFKVLFQNPVFVCLFGQQSLCQNYDNYIKLSVSMFYTPYNYDLTRIQYRCNEAWLPAYADNKLIDYCGMLVKSNPYG